MTEPVALSTIMRGLLEILAAFAGFFAVYGVLQKVLKLDVCAGRERAA